MTTTPVMVRTSERTQFTKCRQHWWWAYKEQRKPRGHFAQPLVFGDLIHRSLAAYYVPETRKQRRRGPHPAETFEKLYDQYGRTFKVPQDKDEAWADARDLGIEMMENYVFQWKDHDKDILVLYPEMPFQFPIYDDDGTLLCIYVGTTDALIKRISTNKFGLFEHKTAAQISTSHLFMDEQANTYWCLVPEWLIQAGIIKNASSFNFMLYNFMRKKGEDDRTKNAQGLVLNKPVKEDLLSKAAELGLVVPKAATIPTLTALLEAKGLDVAQLGRPSKLQPPPLFERLDVHRGHAERQKTLERIKQQVREINAVRRGEMPHYKSPSRECSFCEFKDICEVDETDGFPNELKKVMTVKWEPYTDHVWALDLA